MTITNRTLFFILLTILIIGGGTLSLSKSCTGIIPSSQSAIKISLTTFPGHVYAFIAQEKKLFTKYGVNVELILFPNQSSASFAYESNQAESLLVPFTDAIMFTSKGIPSTVVYSINYSETADVIIGRPEFNSLSELNGKTISFEGFNTFSHLFVITMLERTGIHEGGFKAVNLESSQVLAALKSGDIDAGHTYEPYSSRAIAEGFKVLAKAGDIPNIITDVLVFQAGVVNQRSQEVQGVVNALVEARTWIDTHPTEAFTIMAQAASTSATEMEAGFKTLHALNLTENIEAFQPGGTLFTLGQTAIDFYNKKGQLRQKPPLDKIIDGQFVSAVRGNY